MGGKGYKAPSDTLNIGSIGAGGMAAVYIKNCSSENIVALCDVDDERAAKTYETYPQAKKYRDFRIMLEKEKGLDAVIVGTPDHTHAVAAMAVLQLGKHLYCAKPLTRTIDEARKITEAAAQSGVATQLSVQKNASEDHRLLEEMLATGAIGHVREVHIWSDRPIWPQGIDRPTKTEAVSDTLDWDLWLGPAPYRPYHSAYVPFSWRGWQDFGCGALGDMGCHGFDPIVKALKLSQPISVEASSTPMNKETYPVGSKIHYEFPERGDRPPVRLTWYDGGLKPERPEELPDRVEMDFGYGGILYVGDKGKIITSALGDKPQIIPLEKMKSYSPPKPYLKRSIGHYEEWIAACKSGEPAGANFSFGGPLTEMVLLGNIALRASGKLLWDPKNMRITNHGNANQFIKETYREGWSLSN
ncbi:unnamed protein product [Chrysoparadoxa australica]